MQRGICALCDNDRELCKSHAIPNSVFSFVFRRGCGKAVAVVDDEHTKIAYSSDSWSAYLLCEMCEGDLNDRFDSYGIAIFKGRGCTVKKTAAGISFSPIDRQRLRMFVLSVRWRMAVSPNRAYASIRLPYEMESEIKSALKEKRNLRPGRCRGRILPTERLQRVFFPHPPKKTMTGIGIASGSSPVLLAPFQEVAEFPELINLLVRALDKHELSKVH